MLDAAELLFLGRYNGGAYGPIGTYVNLRTLDYYQQAADGNLPTDGTYILISSNATLSASQIATTINGVLNTSYTSASFHARTGSDAAYSQGQASDDA